MRKNEVIYSDKNGECYFNIINLINKIFKKFDNTN